jgi:hypothetical protein
VAKRAKRAKRVNSGKKWQKVAKKGQRMAKNDKK